MTSSPDVILRPFPLAETRALAGGGAPHQLDWAADFPSTDTIHGLALILAAYAGLGTELEHEPDWWAYQIVVGKTVVGEAGFHGPPDPDGAVEIGYEVVPGWRRRGVATRACGLLLDQAWMLGARVVRAEAGLANAASRRVLTANGFRPDSGGGPDGFAVHRP